MGMTWTLCYCISPVRRCKSSLGTKDAEKAAFESRSAAVLKNLKEYLAEEKFCVKGATEAQHEGNDDAATLGRAFAVCMARQKIAFEKRDADIFAQNRLASDLIALMTSMCVSPSLPGAIARPAPLQRSADVLTEDARRYLREYIEAAVHETLAIEELPDALAQGFFRAHGELQAASDLNDAASSIHHLDLIFDIIEEMTYFWRNQNPHVRDARVAAELDLPEDHPHRRLVEGRHGANPAVE